MEALPVIDTLLPSLILESSVIASAVNSEEFCAKNGVVVEDCKGICAVNTESGRVAIIVLK